MWVELVFIVFSLCLGSSGGLRVLLVAGLAWSRQTGPGKAGLRALLARPGHVNWTSQVCRVFLSRMRISWPARCRSSTNS